MLNMVNGGVTPLIDAAEAQKMGYKIVIWPCLAFTSAYLAYQDAANELKATGQLKEKTDAKGNILGGVREVFEVCGLSKCAAFDQEMGGKAFSNGV